MIDVLAYIRQEAEKLYPEAVKMRRDFHRHPELGFKEVRTAKVVADYLRALNLEVTEGVGKTGVVAVLSGDQAGKTVALRADMDALPIQEETGLDFASEIPGVMHACGHDGHTAMLLQVAKLLSSMKSRLKGRVKFIFQAAEELSHGGATLMCQEGAVDDVDAIFGLHIWPTLETGHIGVLSGPMMASADYGYVTVKGKTGHGSQPHKAVDACVVAAQAILGIQTVVSRQIDALDPAVISIGSISGGTAANVIADEVKFAFTVRALSKENREKVPVLVERTIKGITESAGATYEFNYDYCLPPVINDSKAVALVEEVGKQLLGEDKVIRLSKPVMGSEDFSFFQEKVPGAYFFLGGKNEEKGIVPLAHNSKYNFDEDAMLTGISMMAAIAHKFLS
ncbi:MAG: amidohydrolase [Tepidanaerobacter sp.]|jgi:amidohydrolase|nr:amidohydrolase [Tepidanaerobacter sp.]HQA59817.1 amidohydrolase [Tepidanaerobacteraceae bacterium]HQE05876.1 amidohydrolase [Tepidanaerobacteraceae bacterium]